MYSDAATSCSQIIEGAGGKGKDDFRWRSYDLLGTERKHRQIFATEGSGGGGEEVREVSIIQSGSRSLLGIGSETVEVSEYNIQSSADGETELCVTIRGVPKELELKASLAE